MLIYFIYFYRAGGLLFGILGSSSKIILRRTGKESWEIRPFFLLWELGSTDPPPPPPPPIFGSASKLLVCCLHRLSTFPVYTDAWQSNPFLRQNSLSPLTIALGTKPPIRRFAYPTLPRPGPPVTFCFPCRSKVVTKFLCMHRVCTVCVS